MRAPGRRAAPVCSVAMCAAPAWTMPPVGHFHGHRDRVHRPAGQRLPTATPTVADNRATVTIDTAPRNGRHTVAHRVVPVDGTPS